MLEPSTSKIQTFIRMMSKLRTYQKTPQVRCKIDEQTNLHFCTNPEVYRWKQKGIRGKQLGMNLFDSLHTHNTTQFHSISNNHSHHILMARQFPPSAFTPDIIRRTTRAIPPPRNEPFMLSTTGYVSDDPSPPSTRFLRSTRSIAHHSAASQSSLANLIPPTPTTLPAPSTQTTPPTQTASIPPPTQPLVEEYADEGKSEDEQGDEEYVLENDDQQQHNHQHVTPKKRKASSPSPSKPSSSPATNKKNKWTHAETITLLNAIHEFVGQHAGNMPAYQQTGTGQRIHQDWIDIARIVAEMDASIFDYEVGNLAEPKWEQRAKTCSLKWNNLKRHLKVSVHQNNVSLHHCKLVLIISNVCSFLSDPTSRHP